MKNRSPVELPEDLKRLLTSPYSQQECGECYAEAAERINMFSSYVQFPDQVNHINENQEDDLEDEDEQKEIITFSDYSENNNVNTVNNIDNLNENDTTALKDMNNNGFWKFNENKTLKDAEEYIKSTYHQHYTSEESKVQVLDIIEAIGDGVPFCRDNLIKYSARFGKKDGFSKLDALKIIHYGILLYNFAGFHNNTTDRYETF